MKKFLNPLIAAGLAVSALGFGAASAAPDRHPNAHRDSGVSFSITVGDHGYDRRHRNRYDRYDNRGRHNGYRGDYRGRNGRLVNREVYDTRYRARIVLSERVVRTRHGQRLLCTVDARGPQARYVPNRRLHRIARRECSRRAEIRVIT